MAFYWNGGKNNQLKNERGFSFERIVVAIEEGNLVDVFEHPNKDRYQHQLILIVDIDGYAVCVPSIQEENGAYFLKTLFPSRKYTKAYNLEGSKG